MPKLVCECKSELADRRSITPMSFALSLSEGKGGTHCSSPTCRNSLLFDPLPLRDPVLYGPSPYVPLLPCGPPFMWPLTLPWSPTVPWTLPHHVDYSPFWCGPTPYVPVPLFPYMTHAPHVTPPTPQVINPLCASPI